MYMDEVYKRMPGGKDEIEHLTFEVEEARRHEDHEYEWYLSQKVAGIIYTEIEVQFATYRRSTLYHCFVVNKEFGHTEKGHGESRISFWKALENCLTRMGGAKIEPDQEWD